MYALLLEAVTFLGANGLNFRHYDVGAVLGYSGFEGIAIQHVKHFKLIGHLHGRRTGIGIASDDVHAQTLGGNGKFLAQFARA